jgi:hypothetical protein
MEEEIQSMYVCGCHCAPLTVDPLAGPTRADSYLPCSTARLSAVVVCMCYGRMCVQPLPNSILLSP